jgi:hypothetical protein
VLAVEPEGLRSLDALSFRSLCSSICRGRKLPMLIITAAPFDIEPPLARDIEPHLPGSLHRPLQPIDGGDQR